MSGIDKRLMQGRLGVYYNIPSNKDNTIEGLEHIVAEDGNGKKVKMMIKENQMATIHPGTYCHKNWGYELYSLLKYIFSKDVENITIS